MSDNISKSSCLLTACIWRSVQQLINCPPPPPKEKIVKTTQIKTLSIVVGGKMICKKLWLFPRFYHHRILQSSHFSNCWYIKKAERNKNAVSYRHQLLPLISYTSIPSETINWKNANQTFDISNGFQIIPL